MAEYATKSEVQEIVTKAVDKAVTDLSEIIAGFAQQVDTQFNQVEAKVADIEITVAKIETRLDRIEEEISELRESHNRLLNTVDGFIARIDRYEIEQAARDSQFNRLLEWARKVSEKTGIPLENL